MKAILISLFFVPLVSFSNAIEIEFNNIVPGKGALQVGVFKKGSGFPKAKARAAFKKTINLKNVRSKSLIVIFEGVDLEEFAVGSFQDFNRNKKIDKNFLGIPKEPFGFSNNPRLITGPPSYSKCRVKFSGREKVRLKINLKKLL